MTQCPSCHASEGRPHTDYCQIGGGTECLATKTLGITPHTCLLHPGHEGDHDWVPTP